MSQLMSTIETGKLFSPVAQTFASCRAALA
jgi:hypothetical protein